MIYSDLYVCMNAYILDTSRARAIKFGDYINYYCHQVKLALDLSHAPFRLCKTTKINCKHIFKARKLLLGEKI